MCVCVCVCVRVRVCACVSVCLSKAGNIKADEASKSK